MAVPSRSTDPVRAPLREVRRALLRLHKALIDSERVRFEAANGPLTGARFLEALLAEPFFQWLRPFSQLVASMDEAIFAREPLEPLAARGMVEEAHALTLPDEGPYPEALRRDAGVSLAHQELTRRVAAALLTYDDAR